MKFDPAAVEPLEYDLSVWRPDPDAPGLEESERDRRRALAGEPWTGVIPEPADEEMTRFLQGTLPDINLEVSQRQLELIERQRDARRAWWNEHMPDSARDAADLTDDDLYDVAKLPGFGWEQQRAEQAEYAEHSVKVREDARLRTVAALAEFCSGQPSAAVLGELPWRALQHFLGWVTGQFRPEALAAAISR